MPVSLGIALDTSGSMIGEKIVAAQAALNRFLVDLLGEQDEVFLYRFDSRPELVSPWTKDRRAVGRTLGSVKPMGGTAIYDTVAEAIPLAQSGAPQEEGARRDLRRQRHEQPHARAAACSRSSARSEVLVYAIGIDASNSGDYSSQLVDIQAIVALVAATRAAGARAVSRRAVGRKRPRRSRRRRPPPPQSSSRRTSSSSAIASIRRAARAHRRQRRPHGDHRLAADLDPATAGIADELSRQYFLGYISSAPKDGKWHTIEVQLRKGGYPVRARKGFIAS